MRRTLRYRLHSPLAFALPLAVASLLAGVLFPSAASAEPLRVPEGTLVTDAEGRVIGEDLALPELLSRALAGVAEQGRLRVMELPLAPGQRFSVELRRQDPWAPGARLWRIDGEGRSELPKSDLRHFLGRSDADPSWRVGLWLDPASGRLEGVTSGPTGSFGLLQTAEGHRLIRSEAAAPEARQSCANAADPGLGGALPETWIEAARAAAVERPEPPRPLGVGAPATYQAVIALDTDNEFHHQKFGNDTNAATAWIESLFTAMNVFYERDIDLHLVIGETFFRLDTDPSPTYDDDPFNVTGSPATISHLNEFGTYWANNQGGVDRVLAALLSGKSSSPFSASGIAWVDGYCETQNTGGGYSINQIFTGSVAVSNDARLVGHELGHNFASSHTHCYSPPIDTCWNLEGGCWAGGTSCPSEGSGTLMSYCHIGACGTTNRSEFHPTVIDRLVLFRNAHYPGCVTDFQPADLIFNDGFESGNTTNWS